jgi:branched-chain amino acid transport system ATP-binding protein
MKLLEVSALQAWYGTTQALFGLNFSLERGGITTILGANGAGKTTTLRAICQTVKTAGDIVLLGQSTSRYPTDKIVRMGVAHVPDGRGTFTALTVQENLRLGAYTRRDKELVGQDIERIYTRFPRLEERFNQQAGTLSGGEQQMLAIGRALVTNPKLLILDEATEGLAPLIREEIWQCLTRLRQAGQTLVVVDKYVNRLVQIADRHLILERGSVAWQGSSAELDQDRGLWQRYLGV